MRLVHALVALATASCLPAAKAPPEPAPCRDEALAAILAECAAEVAAAPTATAKARIRTVCLERVNAWEVCQ